MAKKRLDPGWTKWLNENLQRGCAPEELLAILLDNQFHIGSIKKGMGTRFPAHSVLALAAEGRGPEPIDYGAVARPRLTRGDERAVRFDSDKIQLYTINDFLSEAECDGLVAIINLHLRPSTITIPSADSAFRTSQTCDLGLLDDPLVKGIDRKISEALGIHLPYSEGNQAQRYDVGQQFKRHTDYFEPGADEYRQHARITGNRTWTFMVYLNNVDAGGGTRFFEINHTFMPAKGQAVAWNNLREDGTVNPDTAHAGTPVEAGHKMIITKWFRERGTGPMFIDASSA